MTYIERKNNSKTRAAASYPGVISRIDNRPSKKNLLSLDVCVNDSSEYSLYYFNIITKPLELKLGGNIFEFAPPRNRFVVNSQILFEAVDSNGEPIPFEILPQKAGSQSIRICIAVNNNIPQGPGAISLVGEAIVDECGCPLPEDCQGRFNVRWSSVIQIKNDDISGTIEYDTAPTVTVSETQIPWTYQTYEDVYDINPGAPGQPYTVTGSYSPTYNSQPTGGKSGKVDYNLLVAPDTTSLGTGKITALSSTDLRFSASMVGGFIYVSGGQSHINNLVQPLNPKRNRYYAPAFYATISAVVNDTEAEVTPAYMVKAVNPGGDIQDYPATSFHTNQGLRLSWNETSASIAYTEPGVATTTITQVEKTVEQHVSYADITINGLRPLCGVATDVEVYVRSNRVEGALTKLTEFPIEPTNINLDDSRNTDEGNLQSFLDFGVFDNQNIINTYWDKSSSKPITFQGDLASHTVTAVKNDKQLLNACRISSSSTTSIEDRTEFTTFTQKAAYTKTLSANTNYFIEFDAYSDPITNSKLKATIDVYVSGSGIDPTDKANQVEKELGKYIGSITSNGTAPFGETYIGNCFEFKNIIKGVTKPIFVVRTGIWSLANIKVTSAAGNPVDTGITPNTIRTLVPMPAVTRFNDQYVFELRYKNKNGSAKKVSRFENAQFEGNDPSAFIASQPNSTYLSPWFNGLSALTSSKNVLITGSLFVSERIFANEFHTNIVTSSIIFQEGDTIFGNSDDDTHFIQGNITASSNISASGNIEIQHITASGKQVFSSTGNSYLGDPAAFNVNSNGDKIILYNDGSSYDARVGVGPTNNLWLKSYGETSNEGTIELHTGGSERVIVTGDGKVGIGTASPSKLLTIAAETPTLRFEDISSSNYTDIYVNNFDTYLNTKGRFFIQNQGSTKVTVKTDGKVGIGTTAPGELLEIVGNVSASGILYGNQAIITGPITGSFISASKSIYSGGHITASGNISASGTIYASKFQSAGAANETILFNDNLDISGHVTASGAISASGLLYSSASLGFQNISTYNSQSGQYFYTSSQGLSEQLDTFKVTGQRTGDSVITGSLYLSGTTGHLTASGNISASGTGSFESLAIPSSNTDYYIGGSGGGAATGTTLRIGSRTTGNTIAMELFHGTNPVSLGIDYDGGNALAFVDSVHSSFDSVLQFKTGGSERFRIGALDIDTFQIKPAAAANDVEITDNSGNVILYSDTSTQRIGIGTTTPAEKLHIHGGNVRIASSNTNGSNLQFRNNTTANAILSNTYNLSGGSTSKTDFNTYVYGDNPYSIWTNNNNRLIVLGGGNVGIGTTTPAHKLAVEGTTKLGNSTSNNHDITGSIHMKHTNMSVFSGSGRFAFGRDKPGTIAFSNSSLRRFQIYDGDSTSVQLNVTNWETASAYIAGGGVIGANTLAANGPRASISVNTLNSRASYGYGGTRGLSGGSFNYLSDTFEGNTNNDDFGDGGDTDSEGIRLLQEVLHISTGGNPQGSINIQARGDAGQQLRFFTGGDDARNTGGKDLETQRMTITHDGGVGIGTDDPQRRLHVSNSIGYNTSHPIVRLETLPTAPNENNNIVVVDSSGDLYQADLSPDKHYVHDQGQASATWSITHNLAKFPSVTVIDSGNTVVIGQVTYTNTNTLSVAFTAAFSGKAYLN